MQIDLSRLSELIFLFESFEFSAPKETIQYLKLKSPVELRIGELVISKEGYLQPISKADADAPNNTIYYSTTASKLVYKDSGGVVNALY